MNASPPSPSPSPSPTKPDAFLKAPVHVSVDLMAGTNGSAAASHAAKSTTSSAPSTRTVDLPTFQKLLGVPENYDRGYNRASLRSLLHPTIGRNPLRESSIYYTLIDEERHARFCSTSIGMFMYICMISQLAIASILVILGATAGDHHVAVAVLGAVTGVVTGALGLVKGQGQPMRLQAYANALRGVREDVEYARRELLPDGATIELYRVQELKDRYDRARQDEVDNSPDVWMASSAVGVGARSPGYKNLRGSGETAGAYDGGGTTMTAKAREVSKQTSSMTVWEEEAERDQEGRR